MRSAVTTHPVLSVDKISKRYATYRSNFSRFATWFGVDVAPLSEFWAVKDISFEMAKGQCLALIGQNGAGKSTLLKLITGIVKPTMGQIRVTGRISALLELGLGFNPELTGRQNIYQAGGLIGFPREQLNEYMPSVEEFADIGEFFDQPLRVYSSGMQARLAFSLATAIRPEVLIVDEVLAVGDMAFQRKCFRRLEEYQQEGTAILFVSHGMESVKRLCEKAIWIDHGKMRAFGPSKDICEEYEREQLGFKANTGRAGPNTAVVRTAHFDPALASGARGDSYGDGDGYIEKFWISDSSGNAVNVVGSDEDFVVNYVVRFESTCTDVWFGMMIKTVDGVCVYANHTDSEFEPANFDRGDRIVVKFVLKNALAPGTYFLNCGTNHAKCGGRRVLHRIVDVSMLRVTAAGKTNVSGVTDLRGVVTVAKADLIR